MPKTAPILLTIILLLGGCASIGEFRLPASLGGPTPGEVELEKGIARYEAGDYDEAIRLLQAAGIDEADEATRVAAHKYLAFSYCVTDRARLCRRNFDALLRIDGSFRLTPAEEGHPTWGPVFVQARKAAERRANGSAVAAPR